MQSKLEQFEDPIPETKEYLLTNFKSSTIQFEDVIKKSYTDEKIFLPERVLRAAVKDMYKNEIIDLQDTGKRGGIKPHTTIIFS